MSEQTKQTMPEESAPKESAEESSHPVDSQEPTRNAENFEDAAEASEDEECALPVLLPEDLPMQVEAALLTSDRAMTSARIAEALSIKGAYRGVEEAISELNETYERTGRSFRIEKVAGAFQVITLPQFAAVLDGLKRTRQDNKLSAAQLETLAIVAYKQPVVRAQIEAVRGVASGEVLRALMERHLVKIVGRAEEIGRPMLYGTTKQFLEVFGLGTVKDLPEIDELKPV